jgi:DNA polymerase III delta subunit
MVAELMEEGAPEEEVGRVMGKAGTYQNLRKAGMSRARRLGTEGSRQALAAIAEADYRGKKGEIDNEIALEVLVMKLARMPAASRGR